MTVYEEECINRMLVDGGDNMQLRQVVREGLEKGSITRLDLAGAIAKRRVAIEVANLDNLRALATVSGVFVDLVKGGGGGAGDIMVASGLLYDTGRD